GKCCSNYLFSTQIASVSICAENFSPLGEKSFKRVYTKDLTDPLAVLLNVIIFLFSIYKLGFMIQMLLQTIIIIGIYLFLLYRQRSS
ncbi:hypothetical protein WMW72_35415, partial [Paenibacillus filicis]